jgi:hypothetical protein
VSSQIMGPQMNTDQISGLFHNNPCSSVCYRKNPFIGLNLIFSIIFLEPM